MLGEIRARYEVAFPEWDGDCIPKAMYETGREIIPILLGDVERMFALKERFDCLRHQKDHFFHMANRLRSECDALRRERDAAVADIKIGWVCFACKRRVKGNEWMNCPDRKFAHGVEGSTMCDNFEWRGAKGEEWCGK